MKKNNKDSLIRTIIILLCLSVAASFFYSNYSFFHDDAYITLRYARNFIEGKGIVWNEGERIQGYSNFLFLLLISPLGAMGIDLKSSARIVSLISFLMLIISMFYYPLLRKKSLTDKSKTIDLLPFIIVSTSSPLIVWIRGGLEGVMLTALTTIALLTFLAGISNSEKSGTMLFAVSGFFYSLSALTRPDAVIFFAVSFLFLLFFNEDKNFRKTASFLVPALVIFALYGFWAFNYYGDILPNTFYAKATNFTFQKAISGSKYIFNFLIAPPFIFLFAAISYAYACAKKEAGKIENYLFSLTLIFFLYITYVGGDQMPAVRFLLPLIPVISLLLYFTVKKNFFHIEDNAGPVVCLVFLALSLLQFFVPHLNPQKENRASYLGTIAGKYISKHLPPDSLIALNTAGSTPYFAPRNRYIDMLGLNDYHIARRKIDKYELPWQKIPGHLKGDGEYVLSRNPDFIIIGPAQGSSIEKPWFLSDLEISRHKGFSDKYRFNRVILDENGEIVKKGGMVFTYYSRIKG